MWFFFMRIFISFWAPVCHTTKFLLALVSWVTLMCLVTKEMSSYVDFVIPLEQSKFFVCLMCSYIPVVACYQPTHLHSYLDTTICNHLSQFYWRIESPLSWKYIEIFWLFTFLSGMETCSFRIIFCVCSVVNLSW